MTLRGLLINLVIAWQISTHLCRLPAFAALADQGKCQLKKHNGSILSTAEMPTSYWDLSGVIRKVRDGLALTVERRMAMLTSERQVVDQYFGRCRLVYDLWAETFILNDFSDGGVSETRHANGDYKLALARCVSLHLPHDKFASLRVNVVVNPIDEQQEERTRNWLATKGIGGAGSGVIGRALGAVINLKADSVVDYECTP